jgi:hypothetical protein
MSDDWYYIMRNDGMARRLTFNWPTLDRIIERTATPIWDRPHVGFKPILGYYDLYMSPLQLTHVRHSSPLCKTANTLCLRHLTRQQPTRQPARPFPMT